MSKPIRVNSCLDYLSREESHCHHSASAILIQLHPLINVVSNNTSSFHTNLYNIPELLFLGSLTPICLILTACQNIGVELTAKFIQAVDLCAFCEDSQTIKKFYYDLNVVVGFFTGCLSIILHSQEASNLL
jgi:hypothetical protein